MDKKNTMLLTVIAVATLLVAVVGATFAFFTASNTASGTTSAETSTKAVGSIVVAGGGEFHLTLLENDMTQEVVDLTEGADNDAAKVYWGTTDTQKNYVLSDEKIVSTNIKVSDGDANSKYSCDITLTVTKGGDAALLKAEDAEVVFTLSNGAEIDGLSAGANTIPVANLEDSYTIHYERTGNVDVTTLLETAINFKNLDKPQDHFAGKGYTVEFKNADVDCTIE